jgi:hypothetical protein
LNAEQQQLLGLLFSRYLTSPQGQGLSQAQRHATYEWFRLQAIRLAGSPGLAVFGEYLDQIRAYIGTNGPTFRDAPSALRTAAEQGNAAFLLALRQVIDSSLTPRQRGALIGFIAATPNSLSNDELRRMVAGFVNPPARNSVDGNRAYDFSHRFTALERLAGVYRNNPAVLLIVLQGMADLIALQQQVASRFRPNTSAAQAALNQLYQSLPESSRTNVVINLVLGTRTADQTFQDFGQLLQSNPTQALRLLDPVVNALLERGNTSQAARVLDLVRQNSPQAALDFFNRLQEQSTQDYSSTRLSPDAVAALLRTRIALVNAYLQILASSDPSRASITIIRGDLEQKVEFAAGDPAERLRLDQEYEITRLIGAMSQAERIIFALDLAGPRISIEVKRLIVSMFAGPDAVLTYPAILAGLLSPIAAAALEVVGTPFLITDLVTLAAGIYEAANAHSYQTMRQAVNKIVQGGSAGVIVGGALTLSQAVRLARLVAARTRLGRALFSNGRWTLRAADNCFAEGTPLLTPRGSIAIDRLRKGDLVQSRSQFDPEGPVAARAVEEVFVREAPLWSLRVRGQEIHTTAEHPFYVAGRGWQCVAELRVGELLCSHDGQTVRVDAVFKTATYAKVYNVRVAEYHTYFVGTPGWGFSVWAHNAEYSIRAVGTPNAPAYELVNDAGLVVGRGATPEEAIANAPPAVRNAILGTGGHEPVPSRVEANQAAQERFLANRQRQLREAIENAPESERAEVAGRVLREQGLEYQALSENTLNQISGAAVESNVRLVPGLGGEVDNVVTIGTRKAYVETKLTIREVRPSLVNQLTNAVAAAGANDLVILNVARAPTTAELAALRTALGDAVFGRIIIVTSQQQLYNVVAALRF